VYRQDGGKHRESSEVRASVQHGPSSCLNERLTGRQAHAGSCILDLVVLALRIEGRYSSASMIRLNLFSFFPTPADVRTKQPNQHTGLIVRRKQRVGEPSDVMCFGQTRQPEDV